ncbi:MAG: 2-hydroxyacyl-CoA dehydratase family protein [Candidatus Hydrogenedentales bacterium]|jgi:benzoyl-CoA reductase/2-hydroxyglutaryl-CoA dehydratase subunit BcrC/BadD/HgdB
MAISYMEWFAHTIEHSLAYAESQRALGRPVVGMMCEFTPRELIMAAGAVPVCLCAGSASTIPAAEEHLPANLCPLIKSAYGYHVKRTNPFLEMSDLIVAETTCDGKKKMYELMGESRAMHVLQLPHKQHGRDALEYWLNELYGLKEALEKKFHTTITESSLRNAIDVMNRERQFRRSLAELMKRDAPPLTGRQLAQLRSNISGIPADLDQYERALELLNGRDEGCSPSEGGFSNPPSSNCSSSPSSSITPSTSPSSARPSPTSRVRVLLTGVPMAFGAERVLDIIEGSGGLVVCTESCTGLKPIYEDVDADGPDPMRALAVKYFHLPCSVMTRNTDRLDLLRELASEYRVDCIVELIWQACLTYDVEAFYVKRLAEEELNIPYLRIETDYAPGDSARIQVRVEALLETAQSRRSRG